jgi:hypothetical protein
VGGWGGVWGWFPPPPQPPNPNPNPNPIIPINKFINIKLFLIII